MVINDEDGKQAELLWWAAAQQLRGRSTTLWAVHRIPVKQKSWFGDNRVSPVRRASDWPFSARDVNQSPSIRVVRPRGVQSLTIKSRYFSVGAYWLKPVSRIDRACAGEDRTIPLIQRRSHPGSPSKYARIEFRRYFSVEAFKERMAFIDSCCPLRPVSNTFSTAMFCPVLRQCQAGGAAFLARLFCVFLLLFERAMLPHQSRQLVRGLEVLHRGAGEIVKENFGGRTYHTVNNNRKAKSERVVPVCKKRGRQNRLGAMP